MINIFHAEKPRDNIVPVPANVVAPMLLRVKRGTDGDILTSSGSSDARYVNGEVTFTDGPHKGAKAFPRLVVEGSSDGAQTAKAISYRLIGSIVRSAMGVKSNDMGPEVEAKLTNFDFEHLDGVRFIGKTGKVERGKLRDPSAGPTSERYDDKTTIACGVTPDMKEWEPWKNAPRGFNLDSGRDGAMEPYGSRPNSSGDSGAVIETPPWGEGADARR
jgi:hypothetical protein